jgi:hypothetical protein
MAAGRSTQPLDLIMASDSDHRIAAFIVAGLIGLGGSAFFLGPWAFGDVPYSNIPTWAVVSGVVCILFGLWLGVVAAFTSAADVRKTVVAFEAGDGIVILWPYMLYVGSAALWRRFVHVRARNDEV